MDEDLLRPLSTLAWTNNINERKGGCRDKIQDKISEKICPSRLTCYFHIILNIYNWKRASSLALVNLYPEEGRRCLQKDREEEATPCAVSLHLSWRCPLITTIILWKASNVDFHTSLQLRDTLRVIWSSLSSSLSSSNERPLMWTPINPIHSFHLPTHEWMNYYY